MNRLGEHGGGGRSFQAPSDEVEETLQKALVRAEDGEWDEAAQILREALESAPDDPYVLCWLGVVERELGLPGIAYERFKRALAQEPTDPVLLATAGTALAAFDDPAAEAALRTAAMTAPESAQARWRYGAYLAREGMADEALEELDAAVALAPEEAVVHLERGVARCLANDLPGAAISLTRAVELDPGEGWAAILLGLVQLEIDDREEAARMLEEGARLRPYDVEAQLLAALALGMEGGEDRAFEMLERARIRGDEPDRALLLEVEARIEEGSEACLKLLHGSMGPSALRERLTTRP